MAVKDSIHPALELREQTPLEAEGEDAAMPVYDAHALVPDFHQVLIGQTGDVRIMVARYSPEIADLFEVVDQVLRMEITEMDDHVHPGQGIDQRRGQIADAVNVGISYYSYFHGATNLFSHAGPNTLES
jgi:hypothetical protein